MKYNKVIFLCLAIIVVSASPAFTQFTDWFANLNINAYPSPYISDWERDPSIGSYFVSYQGTQSVDFYFRVVIERQFLRDGQLLLAESEIRTANRPFRTTFYSTEFIEWRNVDYNEAYEERVVRSGRLPEGEYLLTVGIYSGRTLLTEDMPAGLHQFHWEPGTDLPGGVYYLTLETTEKRVTRRLVLIR